jgi:hypothetical protein
MSTVVNTVSAQLGSKFVGVRWVANKLLAAEVTRYKRRKTRRRTFSH